MTSEQENRQIIRDLRGVRKRVYLILTSGYRREDVRAMISQVYEDCGNQHRLILTNLTIQLLRKTYNKKSKVTIRVDDERLLWILGICKKYGIDKFHGITSTSNPESIRRVVAVVNKRPRATFPPMRSIVEDGAAA